jgi:nitrite reductase (NADH) large subunit
MSGGMGRPRLVVVGNGMAGMRAVEELLARVPDRFAITVIGAEPHTNYNRIQLSAVLAGDKTLDDIVVNAPSWYEAHGICLIADNRVVAIDRQMRRVTLGDGSLVTYDKFLLATGSKPMAPPIPGLGLPNVRAFRDIADVEAMIEAAKTEKRAALNCSDLDPCVGEYGGP